MRRLGWLPPALLFAVLASGCEDEATESRLRGSLSQIYPLDHESVRTRLTRSELAIEYLRSDGQVAVRLSLPADALDGPGPVDLRSGAALTGRVDDLTLESLVDIESGSATLERYAPEDGAPVAGHFDTTLTAPRGTLTLTGRFDGALEVSDSRR